MSTAFLAVKNNAAGSLASGISSGATSLTVGSGEGSNFPPTFPYDLTIDSEIVRVTARPGSADTLTITRGVQGTTAAAHSSGAAVQLRVTAQSVSDLNTAVNALEAPSTSWDRYVDYVNGNDSNAGTSWGSAKKTIQAAYDALKTAAAAGLTADSNVRRGVGRIFLASGDHQVGAGVVLDTHYAVEITGTRAGRIGHDMPSESASRIVSTSTTATEFVLVTDPGGTLIGQGTTIHDVAFRVDETVNTSLLACIRTRNVDRMVVERCSFGTVLSSQNTSIVAIWQDAVGPTNSDSAWGRFHQNDVSRMALYKIGVVSGPAGNFNRIRIRDNVVFYGGLTVLASPNGILDNGGFFQVVTALAHRVAVGDVVAICNPATPSAARVLTTVKSVESATAFTVNTASSGTPGGGGTVTVKPMIGLSGNVFSLLCDGNNLEGTAVGVEVGPSGTFAQMTFINNSGEDTLAGDPPNPLYDITGSCSQLIIIGGHVILPAGGNGTFVRFNHANAYNNMVIGPYNKDGAAGQKRKVIDNSTTNGNVIVHPNHGVVKSGPTGATNFYKSGAGITKLSDADFPSGQPPPDGWTGVVYDTTASKPYLTARYNNGLWKSVELTV